MYAILQEQSVLFITILINYFYVAYCSTVISLHFSYQFILSIYLYSQLDIPSLTPLFVTSSTRLQLGVAHRATSVVLL